VALDKLELHQETLTNLVPQPDNQKNVGCTLHSDVTFRISCPTHCANPE
jgi:hypothetical protein